MRISRLWPLVSDVGEFHWLVRVIRMYQAIDLETCGNDVVFEPMVTKMNLPSLFGYRQ